MTKHIDGNAIVYCEGAFGTTFGKTAHGLVRRTERYHILSVVDSLYAGSDAGDILDGRANGIPVYKDVRRAFDESKSRGEPATHLIIGIAPDGGRLSCQGREDILMAIRLGLNVDSGLHDFLSEDIEMKELALEKCVSLRDVRMPPPKKDLHFFTGKIEEVDCLKIAILGTDSAIGKRTTAWIIYDALNAAGYAAEIVGTGQTAWMQGARFGIVLDSLVNDFVSGEIEHAVWSAWKEADPDVIILEGQGSLMNPAYPGGFEILAAGRPDLIILQHAPARKEYDGFPGYALHPLAKQIQAIELLSGKPIKAITINHEGLDKEDIPEICGSLMKETGIPAFDVLLNGGSGIVDVLKSGIWRGNGERGKK
jgi:uncharacterized NAD-dependent epimerase/dehydratase family protein